jgi:epsilon-lactone hydrolase
MKSWVPQVGLPALKKRRVNQQTPISELRQFYDDIAKGFGEVPAEVKVEPGNFSQIKGEWIKLADAQPHRMILYLHGGGYVAGSAASHRPLVARLCRSSHSQALSLDYRLAPEYPFPAGLRDAVDAYRLLLQKGISPDAIVIAGDGAGGGLAFAATMAIRNAQMQMPAAVLAMSPWADLTLSGWSMLQHAESDTVLNWEMLFVSARHYLKGGNPADPYASPALGNLRDFPPIMVHAGSHELLRDDASRLGDLAAAANVPVSVEVYDSQQHLFQLQTSNDAKVSMGRLGQFVRMRTPEPATIDLSKSVRKRG